MFNIRLRARGTIQVQHGAASAEPSPWQNQLTRKQHSRAQVRTRSFVQIVTAAVSRAHPETAKYLRPPTHPVKAPCASAHGAQLRAQART